MRHRHRVGRDDEAEHSSERPSHRHHGGHHHRGLRGQRLFDYGELRKLLLALIADRPRHGYELIKEIEERFGGSYVPSPGVIYPTLSWLDDMGYAAIEPDQSGRKCYRITPEGAAFIVANRAAIDELLARMGHGRGRPGNIPEPIARAMDHLKLALRLRFRAAPIEAATAERIAAAIDTAANAIERA